MNIALAIILEEGKVLVGKIKSKKLSEYGGLPYVFPCEGVRDKESAEEELVKEVKKQAGLDIKIICKIGERIHPSTENYTYYFHCEKNPEQDIVISKEIDVESFIWVDVGELENYMPTLFGTLKDYLNKNS